MVLNQNKAYNLINDWEFYKKAKISQVGLTLSEIICRHKLYHKLNEDASSLKESLLYNINVDNKLIEFQQNLKQYKDYVTMRILQK